MIRYSVSIKLSEKRPKIYDFNHFYDTGDKNIFYNKIIMEIAVFIT